MDCSLLFFFLLLFIDQRLQIIILVFYSICFYFLFVCIILFCSRYSKIPSCIVFTKIFSHSSTHCSFILWLSQLSALQYKWKHLSYGCLCPLQIFFLGSRWDFSYLITFPCIFSFMVVFFPLSFSMSHFQIFQSLMQRSCFSLQVLISKEHTPLKLVFSFSS